jgi:hypothetical protein
MIRAVSGAATLAAWLVAASPADAGGSITGRWAADPSACWGAGATPDRSPLVVTSSDVRWLNDDCRIGRSYRTGDTVHLQAICPHAGGTRSVPVSLRPHRDRLQVQWDRRHNADLHRCR